MSITQWEIMTCALCGGNSFQTLKSNDRYLMGIRTCGCIKCGLVQTNPRPDDSYLNEFYRNEYRKFYQGVSHPSLDYIYTNKKDQRMAIAVEYLQRYIVSHGVRGVLDIGCSEGSFFSALIKSGFSGALLGVEPNREFGSFAEKNFGASVTSSLEEVKIKVDLVALTHVFEHILNPRDFLKKIRDYMNENALIYIDVPDAEEYTSINDLHIAHLFHYNLTSLEYLLRSSGFEVLNIEKHTPPNHPKSIRVLARLVEVSEPITPLALTECYESNQIAWRKVIGMPVYPLMLRKMLSRCSLLKIIYKRFRGLATKADRGIRAH